MLKNKQHYDKSAPFQGKKKIILFQLDFFDTIFLKILENSSEILENSSGIFVVKLKQRKKNYTSIPNFSKFRYGSKAFVNTKKKKKKV